MRINDTIHEVEMQSSSAARPAPNTVQTRRTSPSAVSARELYAPMPGLIVKVLVKEGEKVSRGQPLLTIEAMKMENNINAPADGEIRSVSVKPGQEVANKQLLVTFA